MFLFDFLLMFRAYVKLQTMLSIPKEGKCVKYTEILRTALIQKNEFKFKWLHTQNSCSSN